MCDGTVDDDFFGASSDIDDDDDEDSNGRIQNANLYHTIAIDQRQYGELSTRDSAAMERQYFSIGYHETYDTSHEASLQNGFDNGYGDSYNTALCLGKLLGKYAMDVELSKRSGLKSQQSQQYELHTSPQIKAECKLTEAAYQIRNVLLTMTQTNDPRDKSNLQEVFLSDASTTFTTPIEPPVVQQREELQQQQQRCLQNLTDDVMITLGYE